MSYAPAIPPGSPGPIILLVDDEFDVLTVYTMLFEYHGFRVLTAANGAEALAAAAKQPPDIVLSDLMMPVMDGSHLCLAWRADPQLCAIPFILTSAGMLKQPPLPYDSYFKKPIIFDILLADIKRLLRKEPR
jgi:CheY-like chemotaxis protein